EFLASDCITRPLYEEGLLINNFPVVRSRAVDILGIIGSFKTIEFLVGMLSFEWDDYVKNSIIRALGNLQSDKDGNISNGISIYYNNQKHTNIRYLSQILLTVGKIDSYNGTTSRELLAVITNIFLTSSTRATKELALDTINSIKK
ncbi:MAG: HEAT repeat domain-containing protein, partial [Spirochaetales bacterium]|nr:HEAT repeat domain-containing protein [Spirochaetales bacterium]